MGIWLATAEVAWAHAQLLEANPSPGAVLSTSPARVHLRFSEDLNPTASGLVVWNRDRREEITGDAIVPSRDPRSLDAALRSLPAGSYLVVWTSVSADDGHLSRGWYVFSVRHHGPVPSAPDWNGEDLAGRVAVLTHWLELMAVTVWVGAAAASALISRGFPASLQPRERVKVRRLIWLALPVLILSSVLTMLLQAFVLAGEEWSALVTRRVLADTLTDQFRELWVARLVLALLALLLGLAVTRGYTESSSPRELVNTQTILGVLYLLALAAGGHAASVDVGTIPGHLGHLISLVIALDWIHLLAGALWLGGQMYLGLVVLPVARRRPSDLLDAMGRFSPLAVIAVLSFALTGPFNGAVHIPSWAALLESTYGRALLLKCGLIFAMLAISAYSLAVLRPRLRRDLPTGEGDERRLRRLLLVSPILGVGVLLATSVMYYYPVPVPIAH